MRSASHTTAVARARRHTWISARRVLAAAATLTALILVLGAPAPWPNSEAGAPCVGVDVVPTAAGLPAYSETTLCLLNAERTGHGVPPLTRHPALDAAAVAYSNRMVTESFFSHVSPDGTQFVDRLNAGRYALPASGVWAAGENLAWAAGALSTADELVAGWMASPSHRANVLSRDLRDVGSAVRWGRRATVRPASR
jgi:uncharacterized protein YkwD